MNKFLFNDKEDIKRYIYNEVIQEKYLL